MTDVHRQTKEGTEGSHPAQQETQEKVARERSEIVFDVERYPTPPFFPEEPVWQFERHQSLRNAVIGGEIVVVARNQSREKKAETCDCRKHQRTAEPGMGIGEYELCFFLVKGKGGQEPGLNRDQAG